MSTVIKLWLVRQNKIMILICPTLGKFAGAVLAWKYSFVCVNVLLQRFNVFY